MTESAGKRMRCSLIVPEEFQALALKVPGFGSRLLGVEVFTVAQNVRIGRH